MAKRLKKSAKNGGDYELVARIRGSANEIWLAGLGAFGYAHKEGGTLFDALVKQARRFRSAPPRRRGRKSLTSSSQLLNLGTN